MFTDENVAPFIQNIMKAYEGKTLEEMRGESLQARIDQRIQMTEEANGLNNKSN